MPFLVLLVSAVAGAAVWWWRLKMIREGGIQVIDTLQTMRGAYRRRDFRKKAEAAPLNAIANPAIAAVCLLWSLASQRPISRVEEQALIERRMAPILGAENVEETLIFADWAIRSVVLPEALVHRFCKLWLSTLNMRERRQLIDIAEEVCAVQGEPTEEQAVALSTLRRTLLT
jgi:hypothetical protein